MGEKQVKTKPLNSHSKRHARPGIAFIFLGKCQKDYLDCKTRNQPLRSEKSGYARGKKDLWQKKPSVLLQPEEIADHPPQMGVPTTSKGQQHYCTKYHKQCFTKCSLFTRHSAHIFEHFVLMQTMAWDKWTKHMVYCSM